MEKNKTLVLIPVFNHGGSLRQVVKEALGFHADVMVVDDGSTDGSMESIGDLDVRRLSHARNLGKGVAIRTGAKEALSMGYTHIITMDADLQHSPADIPLFKIKIECHPNAIIIGKRDFNTDNVPFSSVFGRSFSNFWLRVETGCKIADVQSGFRAYPLALFEFFDFKEKRYSFEVEVLVKSAWAGIALKEVDISVLYQPKGERISHFKYLKDNLYLTHLNARLTLRSFLPFPHKQFNEDSRPERLTVLKPVRSLKRLADSNMSPARIAMSGAMGVVLGTLPLIACHTLAILIVAGFCRLNKLVSLATSQLCVVPFMPAICIETGHFMRHGYFLTDISMETLGYQCLDRLFEWFMGSLVVAPLAGFIVGGSIFQVLVTMKKRLGRVPTIE
jgi:glycosyltransferase involved in cell wall biosynthesis